MWRDVDMERTILFSRIENYIVIVIITVTKVFPFLQLSSHADFDIWMVLPAPKYSEEVEETENKPKIFKKIHKR
jgi:hypothetical protein